MSSNPRVTNQIATSIRVLQVVKEASEVSQVSPLKPICGVALSILTTIQSLRQIREDHEDLITQIHTLTVAIQCEKWESLPANLKRQVGDMERIFQKAQALLKQEKDLNPVQRFFKLQELTNNLSRCSRDLRACVAQFTMTSLMRITSTLEEKLHMPEEKHSTVEAFKDSEIELDTYYSSTPTAEFHRAIIHKLSHTKTFYAVVKKYHSTSQEPTSAYKRELELWQKLRHANCHQVLGTSLDAKQRPSILLYDYKSGGITQFIDTELRGSAVDSFMMMLRVCQGIACGIKHLQSYCSKSELEACFNPANIAWTPGGRAIVGHGLTADSKQIIKDNGTAKQMDDWIKLRFQNFINSIVYGDLKLSDWNVLMARRNGLNGQRTSHTRLLEHFTSYIIPSFSDTIQHLNALINQLEPLHRSNRLSFKDIRLSAVRLWPGAFIYRPSSPIQCSAGDIGYMKDGTFVVLDKAIGLLPLKASKGPSILIKSSGLGQFRNTETVDGCLRHHFTKVNFASVRRRGGVEGIECKGSEDWEYLLNHGQRIYREHQASSPDTTLSIQDLILIIHVEEDLRVATFDRNCEGDDEPTDVVFVEHAAGKGSWGHWDILGGKDGSQVVDSFPQNIYFVQLEEEEFA